MIYIITKHELYCYKYKFIKYFLRIIILKTKKVEYEVLEI